jgi:MFS family permease
VPTTLVGVVIAGIGTAVCAPTLISLAGRQVPAQRRGRAIATVTALSYLGFLAGPAYVGVIAGWAGLPAGLGAVAVVAVVLAVGAVAIPKPRS